MRPSRVHVAWLAWITVLAASPALAADPLVNGAFDGSPLGVGWTQEPADPSYPLIVTSADLPVSPRSGCCAVWLGGFLSSADALYQDVDIPANAETLELTGYRWIATQETGGSYDHLWAEVVAPGGTEVLHVWSNSDITSTWVPFTLPASTSYAGQTIRVRFRSSNDASLVTNFFIDSCALDVTTSVGIQAQIPPATLQLSAAAPNPTRRGSQLRLDLSAQGPVRAGIFDLQGRRVHTLVDRWLGAGSHLLTWDGTDAGGRRVAPGVYVCRADVDGTRLERTIVVVD